MPTTRKMAKIAWPNRKERAKIDFTTTETAILCKMYRECHKWK
jgi:hypothetical protein